MRLSVADLQTVETLIGELADPDEQRVIYAIDILESLDKRNLITPLLLYHESPRVRARALRRSPGRTPDVAERWLPNVQRMLKDPDADVRAAAVGALASMRSASAADLVRPFVDGRRPAPGGHGCRRARHSGRSRRRRRRRVHAGDAWPPSATPPDVRRDVATAVRQIDQTRVPPPAGPAALRWRPVGRRGGDDQRPRAEVRGLQLRADPDLAAAQPALKRAAREVLVGYGDDVVPALAYFLNDPEEDVWVRRHIPATLARIPTQASMDALVARAGTATDGFLRFKLVEAIDALHRAAPALTFDAKPFEPMVRLRGDAATSPGSACATTCSTGRGCRRGRCWTARSATSSTRTTDRAVAAARRSLYPPGDMDAARAAIERTRPEAALQRARVPRQHLRGPRAASR